MKAFKNSIYATLDVVFAPLFLVIATPIFINQVGIEKYGLWILVNSILASLSIFNFGANETIIKYVSIGRSENDFEYQQKVFSSIIVFFFYLATVFIGLFFFFFYINKYFRISTQSELLNILVFAAPLFFIKQIEQVLFALHKGYENFRYLAKQSFISKSILYLSQIVSVFLFSDIKIVFIISVFFALLYLIIQFALLNRLYGNIFKFRKANLLTFKSILGYGKWTWFSSTILIFSAHVDKWIVSALLGLKVFAYYAIGVSVLNQLRTIFTASISWIFPKIASNQLSENQKRKAHSSLTLYVTSLGLLASIILEKIDFFFLLWLGDSTFEGAKLYLHVFLMLLPLWLMSSTSFYYLLGLGVVKKKFYADIFVLILKIAVTFMALLYFDYPYWPIAFLIPILLEFILFSLIVNTKTKLNFSYLGFISIINLCVLILRFYNIT